jgi:hypothetical protein
MRGIALHRLPFSEMTGSEFCSTFSRTKYYVVFENRTEKVSIHAGCEHSVLMFYGFGRVWVFFEKSAESKGFSANATQKAKNRKKRSIYPFSVEH